MLAIGRKIAAQRTFWQGHPDFGLENVKGLPIVYLLRDNIPPSFMLLMTDGTPGLSALDISSLQYYQRAMLCTALKVDVNGDAFEYINSQRQKDQPLAQFLANIKELTSVLLLEEDTPQLRQAILTTLDHDIKDWILTSNQEWIETLPSPSEIYQAAIQAHEH